MPISGYGDECTWGACRNHPHDPRTGLAELRYRRRGHFSSGYRQPEMVSSAGVGCRSAERNNRCCGPNSLVRTGYAIGKI